MARCVTCSTECPRGSKYCPRCGTVVNDGMNVSGRYAVAIIAAFVGVVLLLLMFGKVIW